MPQVPPPPPLRSATSDAAATIAGLPAVRPSERADPASATSDAAATIAGLPAIRPNERAEPSSDAAVTIAGLPALRPIERADPAGDAAATLIGLPTLRPSERSEPAPVSEKTVIAPELGMRAPPPMGREAAEPVNQLATKPLRGATSPPLEEVTDPGPAPAEAARVPARARSAARAVLQIRARSAELWRRLLASAVDLAVTSTLIAAGLIGLTVGAGLNVEPSGSFIPAVLTKLQASPQLWGAAAVLLGLVPFLYGAAFAVLFGGRSPGRLLAGIRLVDPSGFPPRPVRALLRAALSLLSFCLLLGGFWLALFDRRGQTLHDRLTSTFLVRTT